MNDHGLNYTFFDAFWQYHREERDIVSRITIYKAEVLQKPPEENIKDGIEGNAMEKTFMKEIFYLLCVLLFIVQLQTTAATSNDSDMGNGKVKGMYVPVLFKTSEPPTFICHHFRKVCYLPGLASGWRSWYRKGFSGYLIHKSYLYYVSKVQCPCLFPEPPSPSSELIGHAL